MPLNPHLQLLYFIQAGSSTKCIKLYILLDLKMFNIYSSLGRNLLILHKSILGPFINELYRHVTSYRKESYSYLKGITISLIFSYTYMLNKNSPGLLKKGAAKQSRIKSIAWHLRWLVRTRADIGLRPSGLVRSRTDIKLRPSAFVRKRLISSCRQFDW